MHAMLVDSHPRRLERLQIAFLEAGIHVTGSGSLAVADCCLRRAKVDVLLIEERAGGLRLAELVGLAQRRNPRVTTVLLTDDVAYAEAQLAPRFQSMACILADDSDPRQVTEHLQAALSNRSRGAAALPAPAVPAPVFQSSRRPQAAV